MLKVVIQRSGMSQAQVQNEARIPKNRMTDLVNNRATPRPDEIAALDRVLKQNRQLVFNYCSKVCPAGIYAGYQFAAEMDLPIAGMRLICTLTTIDRLLPQIADMLCEGRLSQEVAAKLSQLRLAIMALEVQLASNQACCCEELEDLFKFCLEKENATAAAVAKCQYQ